MPRNKAWQVRVIFPTSLLHGRLRYCENLNLVKVRQRLLAALALIVVRSTYMGNICGPKRNSSLVYMSM